MWVVLRLQVSKLFLFDSRLAQAHRIESTVSKHPIKQIPIKIKVSRQTDSLIFLLLLRTPFLERRSPFLLFRLLFDKHLPLKLVFLEDAQSSNFKSWFLMKNVVMFNTFPIFSHPLLQNSRTGVSNFFRKS